jgi:hypothetical protein
MRARSTLVIAASMLAPVASACAIDTTLNGNAQAGFLPGVFQSFVDVPTAHLSGLHQQDSQGNIAGTDADLSTPTGRFTLATQARSGGAPPAFGPASGSANADADMVYLVASTTLPPGTPVQVEVRWAVAGRVTVAGAAMMNVQDVAQASLSGQVLISVNGAGVASRSGGYSRRVATFEQPQVIRSGTLNVEEDSDTLTLTVLVGQTLGVFMQTSVSAGTFAFGPATTGADVQSAAVWGASSLTPGAGIVLQEDHSQTAPPASNGTPSQAHSILPGRPTGGCACAPDINCDGTLNSQDFFDFLGGFFASSADYNLDGTTNSQDFFDFLAAFFAGC